MTDISINAEKFYQRLDRLLENWNSNKAKTWGNADALCIMLGTREEDESYSKVSALHLYLLGYEITDSIMIITKTNVWFMASDKKCQYLDALAKGTSSITYSSLQKTKDLGMNRENFNALLGNVRKAGNKIGSVMQMELKGQFIQSWLSCVDQSQLEKVDITAGISLLLSVKDDNEIVSCSKFLYLLECINLHRIIFPTGFMSQSVCIN